MVISNEYPHFIKSKSARRPNLTNSGWKHCSLILLSFPSEVRMEQCWPTPNIDSRVLGVDIGSWLMGMMPPVLCLSNLLDDLDSKARPSLLFTPCVLFVRGGRKVSVHLEILHLPVCGVVRLRRFKTLKQKQIAEKSKCACATRNDVHRAAALLSCQIDRSQTIRQVVSDSCEIWFGVIHKRTRPRFERSALQPNKSSHRCSCAETSSFSCGFELFLNDLLL